MSFKFIDLFAGIGGFHQALDSRGGICQFASEIDPNAIQVYENTWLKVSNNGAKSVSGDINLFIHEDEVAVPDHDVLTAGFPCQPFSKSGHQKGISETRGTLFWSIAKIAEMKSPNFLLLENVKNLIGPKHKEDYLTMIRLIRELGFSVSTEPVVISPHQLPRAIGGGPQNRERIFIAAFKSADRNQHRRHFELPPLISKAELKEFGPLDWNLDIEIQNLERSTWPKYVELTDDEKISIAIWSKIFARYQTKLRGGLPSFPLWTEYWKPRRNLRIPLDTPEWKRKFILQNSEFYQSDVSFLSDIKDQLLSSGIPPSKMKFEWQAGPARNFSETLLQFRPSGLRVKKRDYVPAFVAITQTTILGKEMRRLSVEEAARLQGFSPKVNFSSQDPKHSYKQIGNAVHPGVAGFVFDKLVERSSVLGGPQL